MYTKIGGVVKKPSSLLINAAGTWKRVKTGFVNVAGAWRQFYYDWQAFKLTATSNGPSSSNNYHYETFSQQAITIRDGYRLSFDIYTTSPTRDVGVDFSFNLNNTVANGRSSNLSDQNGYSLHAASSPAAMPLINTWYNRIFSLSSLAGASTLEWAGVLETDAAGTYTVYIRNVQILDAAGGLVTRILGDTLPVTALTTFQGTTTNNYSAISKSMVAPPQ